MTNLAMKAFEMMKRKKKHPAILVAAMMCALVAVISFMMSRSQSESVELAVKPLSCEKVTGVEGVEGGAITPDGRKVFMISGNRMVSAGKNIPDDGKLYEYDVRTGGLKEVTPVVPFEFRPRAIDLVMESTGLKLYVVNMRLSRSFVEVFAVGDGQLVHEQSFSHDLIQFPRSIAVIAEGEYYVSNEFGLYTDMGHMLEHLLSLKKSYISYCKAGQCRVAYEHLNLSGDLSLSPMTGLLYAVELGSKQLHVYSRDDNGDLIPKKSFEFAEQPEQVHVDAYGKIFLSAHHDMIKTRMVASDFEQNQAPSIVFMGEESTVDHEGFQKIYANLGDEISAANWAASFGSQEILVGGGYQKHFLRCKLPEQYVATPIRN